VAVAKETITLCESARTYGVINSHTIPTADFILNRDFNFQSRKVADVLETARTERHRPDPWTSTLRLGLVAVAIAQLALAVPGLVYGSDDGAPVHVAHEVGAWDLALAIAFVFAAWRPLRAIGLLPFAAALSGGLILTAIIDVAHGRAVALTETAHLLELVGTALLYLLMAPRTRPRPALRVVPEASQSGIV